MDTTSFSFSLVMSQIATKQDKLRTKAHSYWMNTKTLSVKALLFPKILSHLNFTCTTFLLPQQYMHHVIQPRKQSDKRNTKELRHESTTTPHQRDYEDRTSAQHKSNPTPSEAHPRNQDLSNAHHPRTNLSTSRRTSAHRLPPNCASLLAPHRITTRLPSSLLPSTLTHKPMAQSVPSMHELGPRIPR